MYTIYSKPNCSFCLQAKDLLTMEQLPFEYKQLGTHYNLDELMTLSPDAKSFPQVFKDGVLIGGFNNLVEYLKQ
jgi:glutaredoxin